MGNSPGYPRSTTLASAASRAMLEPRKNSGSSPRSIFLYHSAGFLAVLGLAMWLRRVPVETDPELHGYLQIITGLLALVFVAVALVRFQGSQDRISLILGSGFLLSGAVLAASSVLFFQLLREVPVRF